MKKNTIGIFGGTFSPIHNGHLRLSIEVLERLSLDQLRLLPAGDPPHRDTPHVSAQRRLEWVRLACADVPGLVVDDREITRDGPSYTFDTLKSLRAEFPQASLVLLLGDDAANYFHRWHRWQEIMDLAHLVFVKRPGEFSLMAPELEIQLGDRRVADAAELRRKAAGCFLPCAIPPLDISSTRVRRLLKAGRCVRGLVPLPVIQSFTDEDIDFLTHDEIPESR